MVLYFGVSLPAYKLAGESFGPATTNGVRFLIAACLLSLLARDRLRMSRRQGRGLLVMGATGIGLMAVLMGFGVDVGSATIASLMTGLEPIGIALAALAFVGERPNGLLALALGLGFLGTAIGAGLFTLPIGEVHVLGVVLMLGTIVTFSIYAARVKEASIGIDALAVAAVTQIGAALFAVPVSLVDLAGRGMVRGDIGANAVFGVLWLGIGSAIAYLLFCRVLADQPATVVAISLYLIPVVGVLASWVLTDERPSGRHAVGGLVILVAIWLGEGAAGAPRAQRRRVAPVR